MAWGKLAPALGTLVLAAAAAAAAAAPATPATSVTIYQPTAAPGFALITERRVVTLAAGEGEVRFEGVPGSLDPSSVLVRDLGDPSTQVLAQELRWDLASADALLARHVGKPVTVLTAAGETSGVLRAVDARQLVLEVGGQVVVVPRDGNLRELRLGPGDAALVTRPTLLWTVRSARAGEHTFEVTYQVPNLSWSAEYAVVVGEGGQPLELTGWLLIDNRSDASVDGAHLRVIAGDVLRAQPAPPPGQVPMDPTTGFPVLPSTGAPPPLRTYEIAAPVRLAAGSTRQLELFPAQRDLGGRTLLVHEHFPAYGDYYRQQGYPVFEQTIDGATIKKIESVGQALELDVAAGPGRPAALPAGRLRVYRRDKAGAISLIAEDRAPPTGPGAGLRVRMGTTGDVTVERRQLDFRLDDRSREMREKLEIRLKNARKVAVDVLVVEHLFRWRNWTIEGASQPLARGDDGRTASARVRVPAGGEAVLTYTARYHTW